MRVIFVCAQCKKPCIHLKALIDHYADKHPDLLRQYSIKHKPSGTILTMSAPNSDILIRANRWSKKDCKIEVE